VIETARLVLREWRASDDAPFFAMGQDADVMRYLGPPMSRTDVAAARHRMDTCQAEHGYCFWALERKADAAFIGFCGLKPGKPPIVGETEIGWRLARDAWGQGYAREAAEASLAWGWANLDVPAITAITVLANTRSWGLMERLGMVRDSAGDFDHRDLADCDPLRRHITYRIARPR
jgi:RimJ/RimL family protein N-acetyltransferase